jgi:hypothetical protein
MSLTSIRAALCDHPASVGETYMEHLVHAGGFGLRMIAGGCACILHGIFPFLFVKTGSKQITRLHEKMVTHRVKDSGECCGVFDFVI